jgi:hypothetical protein
MLGTKIVSPDDQFHSGYSVGLSMETLLKRLDDKFSARITFTDYSYFNETFCWILLSTLLLLLFVCGGTDIT